MAALLNLSVPSAIANAVYGINLLTGSVRTDVVGIFDSQSMRQLFQNARPMGARVNPSSTIFRHPLEVGSTISDHKIINPTEIELSLIIPAEFYNSTYQQILVAFETSQLLTVQTRASVYQNMVIQAPPHNEDPEMYDVIQLGLRLTEAQFKMPNSIAQPNTPDNYSPADPINGDMQPRGLQVPSLEAVAATVASYLNLINVWGK